MRKKINLDGIPSRINQFINCSVAFVRRGSGAINDLFDFVLRIVSSCFNWFCVVTWGEVFG